jgi:Uma2 family endonuclease
VTISPLPPTHLLTIGEYAALGEDEHGRTELMEGNLVMSPSPTPDHNIAIFRIAQQLDGQLPDGAEVISDVDVDLQLVPPDGPGTSRRPDLVLLRADARRRVREEGGLLRAAEVLVAVEILSPGSRRIDNIVKRAEYADAGIPHYWVVDLEPAATLRACRLEPGGAGYRDAEPVTGTFVTDEPFPLRIELDRIS